MHTNSQESKVIVNRLSKTFKIKKQQEGLKNTLVGFIRPKFKEIKAVNDISFTLKKGEIVGFIGPNGAGKSTTLKILSGILYPDDGEINICGLDPRTKRTKLAYKIGTIFGQKPQLWFHLPAIDTFNLFSKIYELNEKEYKKRLNFLVKKFEIEEIIQQPVRKLSLGQRMRCEFVLALLHKPQVLFLDEPTIGMDLIVKKTVRELIKKINKDEKTTIILTSHDMGDVEDICERIIVINHGEIIFDDTLQKIKQNFIDKKIIRIETNKPLVFKERAGIRVLRKTEFELEAEINTKKVSFNKLAANFFKKNDIEDVTIEEPPIEEIIEKIYKMKK